MGQMKTKYLLCYTDRYDEGKNIKTESEDFNDFADALVRYTLMCAAKDNVVLAEIEEDGGKIIRQFSRERCDDESGCVPSVYIR